MLSNSLSSWGIEEVDTPPNEARKALLKPAWTEALVITSPKLYTEGVKLSS